MGSSDSTPVHLTDVEGIVTGVADSPVYSLMPGQYPRRAVGLNGEAVTITPRSKLSGIFTFGISTQFWRVSNLAGGDGTATAVDGALHLTAGTVNGGVTRFESVSHPRYEPDRMFGLATATPGLTLGGDAKLRIGMFTVWEGFFLEADLSDGGIVAYSRRTTGITPPSPEDHTSGGGSTTDTAQGTLTLPTGADLTMATLLDVWVQWRGVGNLSALVDLQEAFITDRLGEVSGLWSGNPALPFAIELERGTANETADFGCVDVSTYDGAAAAAGADAEYDSSSLSASATGLDTTERPLMVIQAAGYLFGAACTRDHILRLVYDAVADAPATIRLRRGATVSNAGVTWSIPDSSRGIVLGVGSATATVTGGEVIASRTLATGVAVDFAAQLPRSVSILPIPGTLTTGTNRGDPAFGGTFVVTVQKTSGGTMTASCRAQIGSLF